MPNITTVTVSFGNGIKRDEYGPVKKAEASITATVAEDEDGAVVLADIGRLAMLEVASLLDAPKPDTLKVISNPAAKESQEASPVGEAPARRRGRPPKAETEAPKEETSPEPIATEEAPEPAPATGAAAEDEWASAPEDIEITDQQILSATSKRAGELGAREPIVKLIASFATRTEGAPFKVQEIPQPQRKDYLEKLAALTA